MTEQTVDLNLIQFIKYPNEERHLEFKDNVKWDGDMRAKITKSIMALANLKDGGWIVIGKHEKTDRTFELVGSTDENYNSYDSDEIKAWVYARTDPPVSFIVHKTEHEGKKYVLIQVEEFENMPIICKKSCGEIIHNGTIYIRSKSKPESIAVPTNAEMHEVIDIAIDKGLKEYVKRMSRIGISLAPTKPETQNDEDLFAHQREGLV